MLKRLIAITLTLTACGIRTPMQHERDFAESLRPPDLAPTNAAEANLPTRRRVSVRLYVDDVYIAQNPNWERRVQALLEQANRYSQPHFGVVFTQAGMQRWEHQPIDSMTNLLHALAQTDPGDDTTLVVGFTSSLATFTRNVDEIGIGDLLGHHIVLRGIDGHVQNDVITNELKMLPPDEKMSVVRARIAHQETLDGEYPRAHYLAGVLDEAGRRRPDAIVHYEKAVALDPLNGDARVRLGRQYRAAGKGAELVALDEKYRARFGRSLP